MFAAVKEERADKDKDAEELTIYKDYLCSMGGIQVHMGGTNRDIAGDCVTEFCVGCTGFVTRHTQLRREQ